jgi:ABC-2 type transport system permease protein
VIGVEFAKQIRRGRTLLSLGAMAAIPALVGAALTIGDGPEGGEGPPFLSLVTSNGLFLPISSVAATSRFFLLVVTALFVGESLASEAGWGTERYVLIRPVTRSRYLAAKLVVGHGLVIAAVSTVALSGLVTGGLLFGIDRLRLFGLDLSVPQALGRLALTVGYVSFDLLIISALSLLVAVLTESAAGAVITAVGVGVVSQILDAIGALGDIRRFLPTHYWMAWTDLFRAGAQMDGVRDGLILGTAYAGALTLMAFWCYENKDVTS